MRGFGQFQSTVDAQRDTDPVPDFSSPLANNATLNFSADSKSTDAAGQREDLRRRLPGAVDADRGHRSWHARARSTSTTPRSSSRTGPGSLTGDNPRWTYVQLHRGRAGLRHRPLHGEEPQAGETRNITIHFAPNFASATQRCDRRPATRSARTRTSRTSRRRRGDDRRPDGRARRRPLDRDPARRRRPERLEREAARRLGAARPGHEPLHGAPVVRRRTSAAQGRRRATRRATGRSPLAGRRSSPLRRTHSRP